MRKLLLLPLIAALAVVSTTALTSAHSRPVRFDPAPGAVLDTAPTEVTGWFTSDLRRADETFIKVIDGDGTEVQTGDIELTSDRRQMSTALQSGLGEGRYIVHWSSFDDADGEVFAGCHVFFVGQAAADAAVVNGQALDAGADCPATVEDDHGHDAGGESTASIELRIPDVIEGDTAELTILPINFTPRQPDGSTVDPAYGHYHIYLDKVPDALSGDHSHDEEEGEAEDAHGGSTGGSHDEASEHPGGLLENPVMWVENSYTFTNLEPGTHIVSVALTYDNHELFDPPVLASATFRVEGDGDGGGIPVWGLALGVIAGLVVGGAGVKLATSRA